MKIKFSTILFSLIDDVNQTSSRFQATILKEDSTFETILDEIKSSTEISIYNDEEELEKVYSGFTTIVAIVYHSDNDSFSIEMANSDLEAQINDLLSTVNEIKHQTGGTLILTMSSVSSLPQTLYDNSILSTMVVSNKELSNPNATITDYGVTIADGSLTVTGVISDTTDITFYLVNTI